MRRAAFVLMCLVCGTAVLVGAWAGELTSPKAKPYVRTHDPAKKPQGPIFKPRFEPRYTITPSDTKKQPHWLLPDDRMRKSHYRTRRMRLQVVGDIGHHWAYGFQWRRDSGMDEFDWHDAFVTYSGWHCADITLGQFKTPTDRLLCTGDMAVPLFERPRSSKLLSADRDVGVMFHDARRSDGKYAWYLGVFNGEGKGRINGFRTLMWAGRFQYTVNARLSVGLSFSANNNTHRTLYCKFLKKNKDPYGWLDYYKRGVMDELTWTVDAHYEDEHWRVFAGYMRKDLDTPGVDLPHASDWYIVGGWKIHCRHPEGLEVAFGYEDFDPNSSVTDSLDVRLYTLGLNWRPHGCKKWCNGRLKDQFRVQYQWRDERGPEIDNDSLMLQYEIQFFWQ